MNFNFNTQHLKCSLHYHYDDRGTSPQTTWPIIYKCILHSFTWHFCGHTLFSWALWLTLRDCFCIHVTHVCCRMRVMHRSLSFKNGLDTCQSKLTLAPVFSDMRGNGQRKKHGHWVEYDHQLWFMSDLNVVLAWKVWLFNRACNQRQVTSVLLKSCT